jgi:hypothetical protein
MSPDTLSAKLNEQAFSAFRAHPRFRAACENSAARSTEYFTSLDPTYQWITKDLGRAAICLSALTLHLMDRLTMQSLTASCLANGVSSAGRVQQLVRRCLDVGAMSLEEGSGLWTRRRMRLAQGLIDGLRGRALIDLAEACALAPEVSGVLPIFTTDEGFASYIIGIATITGARRDLFAFSHESPVTFFLDREAGMSILFDLMAGQTPDRERLYEAAPISRYALARRYSVSRAHINKMLAECGHIDTTDGDRVKFSPELSEEMERHFALIFQLNRLAAESLLSGWRFRPRAAA